MRAGRLPPDEQVVQFQAALRRNRTLTEVLARAARLDQPGWYLVAGCRPDRFPANPPRREGTGRPGKDATASRREMTPG